MIKYKKGTFIFLIALFLLPFEAIKGILPSIYRPVSIYPLSIVALVAVLSRIYHLKMDRTIVKYLIFCIYCIISTTIITRYNYGNFDNAIDFFITLAMGICVFIAGDYGFYLIKKGMDNDDYIFYVFKFLGNAYFIMILIGILELLSIVGIIPMSVKLLINKLLGAGQLTRVCMGSSEASWLSMHLLMMMPIYIYLYKRTKLPRYMAAFVFLCAIFIFDVSGQGIITLAIAFVIYYISKMKQKNDINVVVRNIAFGIFLLIAAIIVFKFIVSILPNSYYTGRLKNFTSIKSLIESDASAFIRIIYPYMNFKIFLNNPIFGIGGGNFGLELGTYLSKFYPWAPATYAEVSIHIASRGASTYSFYFRLLGEFGIIGFILFVNFAKSIVKKYKAASINEYRNILLFLFILIFVMMLQFDSFTYVPFFIMLSFYNNLSKRDENDIAAVEGRYK